MVTPIVSLIALPSDIVASRSSGFLPPGYKVPVQDDDDLLARAQLAETDVTFDLRCDGFDKVSFCAHRYVLAHESEVFRAMFYGPLIGDMRFKMMLRVDITDAEPEPFKEMLKFVYHKKVQLTEDNAMQVLFLSSKYMLEGLRHVCLEFLEERLTPENFGIIWEACLAIQDRELEERLLIFYRLNATQVLAGPSLPELSKPALTKLVELDVVNARELDVYRACCEWGTARLNRRRLEMEMEKALMGDRYDETKDRRLPTLRGALGEGLVRNVRFPAMSKRDFEEALTLAPLLTCREAKAVRYAISTRIRKESLEFSMQPRRSFGEVEARRANTGDRIREATLVDDYLNRTTLIPLVTVYLTGVKVAGKIGYNRVHFDLKFVGERGDMPVCSQEGRIDLEGVAFRRPVKVSKDTVYSLAAKYDRVGSDGEGKEEEPSPPPQPPSAPPSKERQEAPRRRSSTKRKLEEVFYIVERESAIVSLFYYPL